NTGKHKVYLGYDWLMHNQPEINWSEKWLSLPRKETPPVIASVNIVDEELLEIMKKEFPDIFSDKIFTRGAISRPGFHYEITLKPGAKPFRSKLYPMNPEHMKKCREYLDQALTHGHIEPCKSEWSSPFFFKKELQRDGTHRLRPIIDYTRLNDLTVKNCYPLPLLRDLVDGIGDDDLYTLIDVMWGFHNLPMDKQSQQIAAICTIYGI